MIGAERRKHCRIGASPMHYEEVFARYNDHPSELLNLVNISQRGIGFKHKQAMNLHDHLNVTIVLPRRPVVLCDGEIVFRSECGGQYGYGMELAIAPKDEEMLARYIECRRSEH